MSRYALLSVSDKRGIVDFARGLKERGYTLLSTGGTARALREAGLEVTDVSAHTGFPEIMAGRVKTLHPKIHGGILARRGTDEAVMAEHGIGPIDVVAVNLYPFRETIAREGCSREEAVEQIDIGGPAMLRAAAKNHAHVWIVVEAGDYPAVLAAMDEPETAQQALRNRLAARAFAHTAAYDQAIAHYLAEEAFPEQLQIPLRKKQDLRYGENPHQQAAFYTEDRPPAGSIARAESLQGKPLSYNNIADADAAIQCVQQFEEPACVIVKHANPCGVALAEDNLQAYERAYATDPVSAFGGIIAFNRPVDEAEARTIIERQFVEVLAAPAFSEAALAVLASKPNVRVLALGEPEEPAAVPMDFKRVAGGLLVQQMDDERLADTRFEVVTDKAPTEAQLADLRLAWQVARFVKSNAIVYVKDGQTVGIGAGQMSRVVSARIAGLKAEEAGLPVPGAVMASDAFFPFRDGIDAAAQAGIAAVIQPGGSMRDQEVIDAANEHGMAMVFTGVRHFRH